MSETEFSSNDADLTQAPVRVGKPNGSAFSGGTDCVVGRGTMLVRHLGATA